MVNLTLIKLLFETQKNYSALFEFNFKGNGVDGIGMANDFHARIRGHFKF